MSSKRISDPAIRRLPLYYRCLGAMKKRGITRTSSAIIARETGLTSSQIRQDLSSFGTFGNQGYGYNVISLMDVLSEILGMRNGYSALMIGVGHLGNAILGHYQARTDGITLKALYDVNPEIVGNNISGIPVYHVDALAANLKEAPIDLAILAVPPEVAPQLVDVLAECGVKGVWNFTNVDLTPRTGSLEIENVHFFDSLFSLCCKVNGY